MRTLVAAVAVAVACAAAARAGAQPTPAPTPSGAGAVTPSDQTAVQPALPDERANRNLPLGTSPPTPAPLPVPAMAPFPVASAPTPAAGQTDVPGRSEPNTGAASTSGGHRKPSVRGVTVGKEPTLTVVAYEPGKSLTLRRPEGTAITFGLAKKADVPKDLAPGRSVTIRTRSEGGKKVVTRVRPAADTPILTNVD